MPEKIRRVDGYDEEAFTYYPVAIIGAGESGIAMGCRLKERLGFDQFRIFDRQSGIGGTWWINRYPGVACDIPAIFYSFSFCPNPNWTSFHPSGREIVKYFHQVCEKYSIVDKIQLDTEVGSLTWLEKEELWEITLHQLVPGTGDLGVKERIDKIAEEGHGAVYMSTERIRAKVVISGIGGLSEPKQWPSDVPGIESFKGPVFHCARWDQSVDFTSKDVVVVGTGCSAAQVVPNLIEAPYNAGSVTQLMRSPPWVSPRPETPLNEANWAIWAPRIFNYVPFALRTMRLAIFLIAEYDFRLFGDSAYAAKERTKVEAKLLAHMRATTPKEYHKILTPNYYLGCKRRVYDAKWFPKLHDPRIRLTTKRMVRVEPDHVVVTSRGAYGNTPAEESAAQAASTSSSTAIDGLTPDEERIPASAIVLANGFNVTRTMLRLPITGRHGASLSATMSSRGGMQAYNGTAMDLFPNFFFLFGPNTATGHSSVILASECQVEYAITMITPILRGEARTVEVKEQAERGYTEWVQRSLRGMNWNRGGCSSWYVEPGTGWNGTVFPKSQFVFAWRAMWPRWGDWEVELTRKGRVMSWWRRVRRAVVMLVLVRLMMWAVRLRRAGVLKREAVGRLARMGAVMALTKGSGAMQGWRQRMMESM